ncbi:MAG TPA: hypothetical protein VGD65_06265 [Chryseosolibacter sp.]
MKRQFVLKILLATTRCNQEENSIYRDDVNVFDPEFDLSKTYLLSNC